MFCLASFTSFSQLDRTEAKYTFINTVPLYSDTFCITATELPSLSPDSCNIKYHIISTSDVGLGQFSYKLFDHYKLIESGVANANSSGEFTIHLLKDTNWEVEINQDSLLSLVDIYGIRNIFPPFTHELKYLSLEVTATLHCREQVFKATLPLDIKKTLQIIQSDLLSPYNESALELIKQWQYL